MYDPRILHSFQRGTETVPRRPEQQEIADNDLPDYEVFVHDHGATIDYPSHYEPGTGVYHSSVHAPPEHAVVPMQVPAGARLHSDYEAVH